MRKWNLRVISFVLLLVFTQKLGLGLWLHDWLHEPRPVHSFAFSHRGKANWQVQPVKCSCLEDATMPLIESAAYIYSVPKKYLIAYLLAVYSPTLSNDRLYAALRGPPLPLV